MSFLKKILGDDRDDIEEENVDEVEQSYQNNPTSAPKPVSNQRPKPEFVLIKPDKRDDIAMIADNLLKRKTVILNLELVTKDTRRFVDFLSGVAYALGGQIKKVATGTFLIIPGGVEITGDIFDEMEIDANY